MEIVDSALQPTETELSRQKLRQRWELASVLNFLSVFEPVIQTKLKISAEEIETALIEPNDILAQLHIALLKGIPPVNKVLNNSDGWVEALSKKLEMWWPWVAEGKFPLTAVKGEQSSTYQALDPTIRLLILKALCEIRADQDDTVSFINHESQDRTHPATFRKAKLGGNGKEISFWYDGNETIGYRLYKEVCKFESRSKVKDKNSIPVICSQWETLATNLEEFQQVVDKFSSSQVNWESAVGKAVEADAIPDLQKTQKKKDMALRRQQRKHMLLEGLRKFSVARSCRNRKPTNYRFDDYDRAIKEAIQITNKRKTLEAPKCETRLGEHGPNNQTNSLDSLESNSISSDATESESDDADDTSDEENEPEANEGGKDSKKKGNIAGNRKQTTVPQTKDGPLDHRPRGSRYSERLAGDGIPESIQVGAKNKSRQRPTLNTAVESAVVPDSEDENSSTSTQ